MKPLLLNRWWPDFQTWQDEFSVFNWGSEWISFSSLISVQKLPLTIQKRHILASQTKWWSEKQFMERKWQYGALQQTPTGYEIPETGLVLYPSLRNSGNAAYMAASYSSDTRRNPSLALRIIGNGAHLWIEQISKPLYERQLSIFNQKLFFY